MSRLIGRVRRVLGVAVVAGLCLIGGAASAANFVSFNGKFHFSYPNSWAQVDYQTADFYLSRGDPDVEVEFEALFSEREIFVLFQGQYLILTVDTIGTLSTDQVDSVLTDISAEFDRPVKECSTTDFMTRASRDSILFDRENGLVAIETEVAGDDSGPRISLLVMKFYKHGIANYYFYTPRIEFEASLPVYKSMVTSFSSEDMATALQSDEPVRVADLDENESNNGRFVALFGGLVAILIVIIASRAKAKRENKTNNLSE